MPGVKIKRPEKDLKWVTDKVKDLGVWISSHTAVDI